MKKVIKYSFIFLLITFIYFGEIKAGYNENNIGTYEQELAKFPNDYKGKIQTLHNIYPNAIFVAQDKFFDWKEKKEIAVDWNKMLGYEYYTGSGGLTYNQRSRNLIYDTLDEGYRSHDSWAYNYYDDTYTRFDNGHWFAAAKDTVAYYMDSRNFLDESYVFMFESNLFHDYQTVEGVENILSGTFMANKLCPGDTKKYSEVIMEAAKKNDVSAYMLASRLKQEQGTNGTSSLISGTYSGYNGQYKGYYNYFNVKASGNSNDAIIKNGLEYAKNQGWDTPYKSIVNGASFIKTEYVGINDQYNVKGQLSGYLQKFDPYGNVLGAHQYMQNITAHYTEALSTYNSYAKQSNYKNYKYIFYIPIYANMPTSTALPKKGNPNNWLKNLTVNGATVSGFDSSKTDYSINVASSTNAVNVDYVKVSNKASVKGNGTINLNGDTTKADIQVTAGNGDVRTYHLTINKSSSSNGIAVSEIVNASGYKTDGTYLNGINIGTNADSLKSKLLSVSSNANVTVKNAGGSTKSGTLCTGDIVTITSGNETKNYYIVIYGDVNGDGQIKASDYVLVKNSIMATKYLSGASLKATDVNKDGSTKASDYVLIKNNIMGTYSIKQ